MSKRDYATWTHSELVEEIKHLKSQRKFGLVWEDQQEAESLALSTHVPVVKEVPELNVLKDPTGRTNLLVEGDNLHSLALLNYTHNEAIDVIYIDPPYNTGQDDFLYNDKFVAEEDSYRHSKWLSFMSKRLILSRNLLKDDGVIFASIGNDEHHRLRMLMEDIFGESNFVASIARVAKTTSDQGTHFAPSIDFILVFAKNKSLLPPFSQLITEEYQQGFKREDEKGKFKEVGLYQAALDPMRGCINQRYFIETPDGSMCIPPGNVFPDDHTDGSKTPPKTKSDKVWRWSRDRYLVSKSELVFKRTKSSPLVDEHGKKSPWNVYVKQYLDLEKGALPRDFYDKYQNTQGTLAVKQLGLEFSFAKPVWLIADLIAVTGKKEATVLDFFAGSGTTGQAVLELNRSDGGSRSFILCTNNEGKIAEEICQPRLARVIGGYESAKYDPFLGIPANLRYFKLDSVEHANTDASRKKLTKEAVSLLCLKENAFEKVSDAPLLKVYKNSDFYLVVLLDPVAIEDLFALVRSKADSSFKVYVFSLAHEDLSDELAEFGDRVTSLPVPEGILNTYVRTLGEIKRRS